MRNSLFSKLTGGFVFLLILILYIATLEPTTSFWDCSEFILSAAKMEINHPAGAPLFMLLGRIFTFCAFGSPEKTAWSINLMSAFFSAGAVFFLFHTIRLIVLKICRNKFLVQGSAVIGSLTFAVTDSFWFSAVESEVYGLSMFVLILSFWAILKWEAGFDKPGNEKWLLFLALITGLGIGVHLLNLLVIPSVVLIFGFKKYGYSLKNTLLFFVVGFVLIMLVLYGIIPAVLKFLAFSDYVFVNHFHLPLNMGVLTGIFLIFLLLSFLILYFQKKQLKSALLVTYSLFLFLAGFAVYSVNVIRSSADPPVNFGRPNNIYSLIHYLNREQYPSRPLLHGQNYNSPITGINERHSKNYLDGKYRKIKLASEYEYNDNTLTFFPRMYSRDENHVAAYKSWIDSKGKRVRIANGNEKQLVVPNFSDNLRFFIRYQFGYMFGRYFMWNFAGRQNNVQGDGGILYGNWLSGIGLIDNWRLGPQEKYPDWLKRNKARNTYFFIPLVLGIIGFLFHVKKERGTFWTVLSLFLMGGLGLTVYLNEVPITPRERDYVFVGAYMSFSVWIGISFLAIVSGIEKLKGRKFLSIAILIILLLICPVWMFSQNLDDHDRSGRSAARDFASNILNSCPKDAILFTSGDNDTYPLLYCQEVEGIRTDVRIVIMPFLSADWFIDGLREPKYGDEGLKMIIPQEKYDFGKLDYIPVVNRINRDTSWEEGLKFVKSENRKSKVTLKSGGNVDYIPTENFSFRVCCDGREGEINISLEGKNAVYKHELAFWDIVSSNAGHRPVCFVSNLVAKKYSLQNYLKSHGFVYQIVPEKNVPKDIYSIGNCNAEELYRRITEKYEWGNLHNNSVYVDWDTLSNFRIFQIRIVLNDVARLLLQQGQTEKATELLMLSFERFPYFKFPYDVFSLQQVELLYEAGLVKEALELFSAIEHDVDETLDYFRALKNAQRSSVQNEIQQNLFFLNRLAGIAAKNGMAGKEDKLEEKLQAYLKSFS